MMIKSIVILKFPNTVATPGLFKYSCKRVLKSYSGMFLCSFSSIVTDLWWFCLYLCMSTECLSVSIWIKFTYWLVRPFWGVFMLSITSPFLLFPHVRTYHIVWSYQTGFYLNYFNWKLNVYHAILSLGLVTISKSSKVNAILWKQGLTGEQHSN